MIFHPGHEISRLRSSTWLHQKRRPLHTVPCIASPRRDLWRKIGGFPGFLDILLWIDVDLWGFFLFLGGFFFFGIYGDFLLSGTVGNNRGTYFLQRNVYRATASHLSGTSEKIQPLRSASMFTTKQDDVDGLKVNI